MYLKNVSALFHLKFNGFKNVNFFHIIDWMYYTYYNDFMYNYKIPILELKKKKLNLY